MDQNALIDIDANVWVWCVGGRFKYPQALLLSDAAIYDFIGNNPKIICFLGRRSLAEVNWSK